VRTLSALIDKPCLFELRDQLANLSWHHSNLHELKGNVNLEDDKNRIHIEPMFWLLGGI
jgi:hypothetical protein